MERTEITRELKKEIRELINIAEKGNGYGDGFDSVSFFGKFTIKYDESKKEAEKDAEKEFDFILDALKFYNSIKKSKAFCDESFGFPELIIFNEKSPTNK